MLAGSQVRLLLLATLSRGSAPLRRGIQLMKAAQSASSGDKPLLVVVSGPTGVGKSKLGLHLCETLGGELVSADSVQIFRGMDVGSNKASLEEQERIRHHCLDTTDVSEDSDAGSFYNTAFEAIDDIIARGRLPVVVGGTMMYLDWLVDGQPDAVEMDLRVRERVAEILKPYQDSGDWEGALALLTVTHPERAAKMTRNDWYRLSRALELVEQAKSQKSGTGYDLVRDKDDVEVIDQLFTGRRNTRRQDQLDIRCFFLAGPRKPLGYRIERRCLDMLESGLFEEVAELLLHPTTPLRPDSTQGKAIGYRQVIDFLARPDFPAEESEFDRARSEFREFLHTFGTATRRYAQKQVKWFRNRPDYVWVWRDLNPGTPYETPERAEVEDTVRFTSASEEEVASLLECPRAQFEAELQSERQRDIREASKKDAKANRTYRADLGFECDEEFELNLVHRAITCAKKLLDAKYGLPNPPQERDAEAG